MIVISDSDHNLFVSLDTLDTLLIEMST